MASAAASPVPSNPSLGLVSRCACGVQRPVSSAARASSAGVSGAVPSGPDSSAAAREPTVAGVPEYGVYLLPARGGGGDRCLCVDSAVRTKGDRL